MNDLPNARSLQNEDEIEWPPFHHQRSGRALDHDNAVPAPRQRHANSCR